MILHKNKILLLFNYEIKKIFYKLYNPILKFIKLYFVNNIFIFKKIFKILKYLIFIQFKLLIL